MRPLSVGELLDAAFAAVRRNFGTLVACTIVVVVPVAILNTLITASATDHAFDFTVTESLTRDRTISESVAQLATSLLGLLAQTLVTAACLRALGGDIVGSPARARESLQYAGKRLGPLLSVSLLYVLALIAGVFMCLVGTVWLGVLFSLAVPAVLFEEARGSSAMRRSQALIADHWWRTFGAILVGVLLVSVLQFVIGLLAGGVILSNSSSQLGNAIIFTALNIVALAISLPFAAALLTYIYFDLRVRKEGFDLQLLASKVQAPGPVVEGLPPSEPGPPPGGGGFLPPQPPGG